MDHVDFTEAQINFLSRMRVARLATADAQGQPHVIPIVFAIAGERIFTPLDGKPKRAAPGELKRVRNLLANPKVAIVVDEYDEDWTRLAWVMIRGTGEIVETGEWYDLGKRLLEAKYPQYGAMPLDNRPLIAVTPWSVLSWGAL